jgi:hypothetical protein
MLPLRQLEQEKLQRFHLGALVDREQRDQLVRVAQQADRSTTREIDEGLGLCPLA